MLDPAQATLRRIDTDAAALGFLPPPCALNLRLRRQGQGWEMVALMPTAQTSAVTRWLQPLAPTQVLVAPGLAPRSLRALFATVPSAWPELVDAAHLHHALLFPNGVASLFAEGSQAQLEALVAQLQVSAMVVRARAAPLDDEARLTPRQIDALTTAVALGYYEIPHRLDLRALAANMHISLGAVSELLRRAESLVITSFVDSMAAKQWRPVETAANYLRPKPDGSKPVRLDAGGELA